jgi:Tol biopolymer transport system component
MGAIAARLLRESPPPPQTIRFDVSPPPGGIFPGADSTPRMAMSPDGRYLAFTANLQDGKPDQLWIRRLDSLDATQLTSLDTTAGEPAQQPFWSPDSRFVGFFHDGKLKKVDIEGRVVQTLCNVPGTNFGGAWNSDGMILFGSNGTEGLQLVSAGGGVPAPVTTLEATPKETRHLWPRFLPDGRHFMYQAQGESAGDATIFVAALDAPGRTPVIKSAHMVEFAPPDLLLFVRDDALLAQRFDIDSLELRGDPVAVTESVQMAGNGRAGFTVSATGVLAYRSSSSGGSDLQLAWLDRSGREVGIVGEPATFRGLELSPDDRLIAAHKEEAPGSGDLWVLDIQRGSTTRLTFDAQQHNTSPTWSPDGRRIVFAKSRGGAFAVYERAATGVGDERMIYESKPGAIPWSVSPDGKALVITENQGVTGADLGTLGLDGSDTPATFVNAPALQALGQLSPDGRWIAYASGESGQPEVYVRSFPAGETRYQISTGGGSQPRWRAGGRELFYRANAAIGRSALLAVSVEPEGNALRLSTPKPLFELFWPGAGHAVPVFSYDVTSDGQRFLVARPAGQGGATVFETPVTVVVNWDAAFR